MKSVSCINRVCGVATYLHSFKFAFRRYVQKKKEKFLYFIKLKLFKIVYELMFCFSSLLK